MARTPRPELKHRHLDAKLSAEARDVICRMTINWGLFDSVLTEFTLKAFGASHEEGSILIGNMDTRTKLDRLGVLFRVDAFDTTAA